jgi:hypothetical protein
VQDRGQWLSKLASQVKGGTRLVIVEFKEGELPEGPPASVKISKDAMIGEVEAAGFEKVAVDEELLPYQYMVEFQRR